MTQEENQATLSALVSNLRQFKGLTRKSAIGELSSILGESFCEDAGVLEIGDVNVVVSTDGIVENLVRDDPWLAGFYSVVVNVNDVVAKGARPLGYAHVLSSSSSSVRRQIAEGIKQGIDKYGLKFLKGHTHPDALYDAIDAAVIGVAHNVLWSTAAQSNDSLIVAVDLDGDSGMKGWVRTFDSVVLKTRERVAERLEGIVRIAESKLAHACKDISGPGIVGTIAMLCDSSNVGALVAIDKIPKPSDLDVQEWLMTYPSTGFIFATSRPQECLDLLRKCGFTAQEVGTILETRTLEISYHGSMETFMNFEKESIFRDKQDVKNQQSASKIEVKSLFENDAQDIEALLKKVWSSAYEYPEEWRKGRILPTDVISKEMQTGHNYFGIRIDSRLVGVYKALVTEEGLFGEHQSVDSDFRGLGLATAMYHQFIKFAKESDCEKVYVNVLANQMSTRKILDKMGFRKKGQEFEQARGMKVQMWEKDV